MPTNLNYPPGMAGVHPVFHESLLSLFKEDKIPGRTNPPPLPLEIIPGGDRYEVEKIIDSRRRGKGVQYLVKWKGYSSNENSWEPSRNIDNAQELIQDFHQKYPRKPSLKLRQMRAFDLKAGVMSRIQLLISKISHTCQEIRDIKSAKKPKSNLFKPNYTITSLDEGQKDRNCTQEPGSNNSAKEDTDDRDGWGGTYSNHSTLCPHEPNNPDSSSHHAQIPPSPNPPPSESTR